jgi:2',3'-cyclic-nucleotide 2'-phosphodiesterase (5'-nucleotidase family)
MRISFSYALLITWLLVFGACGAHYVQTKVESANLIVSDSIAGLDSQIVRMYLPYKHDIDREMSKVIGMSAYEMVKDKPESELTNFLADLLLVEGKRELTKLGKDVSPHLSFFNYGGIRTFLPKGEITVRKIFELMPFENEMVFLKLAGDQVNEFLNIVAEKGGDSVGGVRFTISGSKATGIMIGGEPLIPGKEYWLVTNDYVASGGDGIEVFAQRRDFIQAGVKIRDAIISHMERNHQNGEIISARKDGRITQRVN